MRRPLSRLFVVLMLVPLMMGASALSWGGTCNCNLEITHWCYPANGDTLNVCVGGSGDCYHADCDSGYSTDSCSYAGGASYCSLNCHSGTYGISMFWGGRSGVVNGGNSTNCNVCGTCSTYDCNGNAGGTPATPYNHLGAACGCGGTYANNCDNTCSGQLATGIPTCSATACSQNCQCTSGVCSGGKCIAAGISYGASCGCANSGNIDCSGACAGASFGNVTNCTISGVTALCQCASGCWNGSNKCQACNTGSACGCLNSGGYNCDGVTCNNPAPTPGNVANCSACTADCQCLSGHCKTSIGKCVADPNTYGTACGCNNSGTYDCNGACPTGTAGAINNCGNCTNACQCQSNICTGGKCVANSLYNQGCGCSNSGTVDCNGSCPGVSAGNMADCQAPCTLNCQCVNNNCVGGICAAVGAIPGTACYSAPNSCGQTASGFVTCHGTCTASGPPSKPANLPYPCTQ